MDAEKIVAGITATHSLLVSYDTASAPFSDGGNDDVLWQQIEALFGVWADREDLDDDWVETLRHGTGNRLKEIYGDDWE